MSNVDLSQIFHALGDNTRFTLFQILGSKSEICVGALAEKLDISSACVSQHMKILADAGLVVRVREGQRVCYQISRDTATNMVLNNLIFEKEK